MLRSRLEEYEKENKLLQQRLDEALDKNAIHARVARYNERLQDVLRKMEKKCKDTVKINDVLELQSGGAPLSYEKMGPTR